MIRIVDEVQDVREVYLQMLSIYESTHNLEQVCINTFNQLNSLAFHYNYPKGYPKFLQKFQGLLLDLEDAGKPMENAMMKSFF